MRAAPAHAARRVLLRLRWEVKVGAVRGAVDAPDRALVADEVHGFRGVGVVNIVGVALETPAPGRAVTNLPPLRGGGRWGYQGGERVLKNWTK